MNELKVPIDDDSSYRRFCEKTKRRVISEIRVAGVKTVAGVNHNRSVCQNALPANKDDLTLVGIACPFVEDEHSRSLLYSQVSVNTLCSSRSAGLQQIDG